MQNNKGSALYFSLVILSILMVMVFGLGSVMVIQIKNIKQFGDSIVALCAADSGVETALYGIFQGAISPPHGPETGLLENGASFEFLVTNKSIDPSCASDHYCIKSIGVFRGTRRGIKITGM